MKQLRGSWVFVAAAVAVLCGCGGHDDSQAREFSLLEKGQVHEGWYFAAGQTVMIEGTVNGDVYAAGGDVEISGTVNGDVIAAGGTVEISGTVSQDVRTAGGTLRINGIVDGSCTLMGGTIVVGADGLVKEDLLAMGGAIRISGRVEDEVKVFGQELTVSGTIGRDLQFGGDRVEILEGAVVGGDATLELVAKENATIAEGTVRGKTTIRLESESPGGGSASFRSGFPLFTLLYGLSLVAAAIVAVFVFPKQIEQARGMVKAGFGLSFLWGLVGLVALPFAIALLLILVIGIPLGLFVLALYLWFLYLSQLSLPLLASTLIVKDGAPRGWRILWPMIVGIIVLLLLLMVPYLDFLLWLVGAVLGMGVVLRLVGGSLKASSSNAAM